MCHLSQFLSILVNTTCCEKIEITINKTSSAITLLEPAVFGMYQRMDNTVYHQTAWRKVDNEKMYLVKHSDIINQHLGNEPNLEIVQSPNYWKVCRDNSSFSI